MGKKGQVKLIVNVAKSGLGILLTALFGIFAFVVVNIETITKFQMYACIIGAVIIAVFFVLLLGYVIKNIKKMRKL